MIQIHQKGRSRHVLTDAEGYIALKRVFSEARTKHPMDPRHPYTAMVGLAVYVDECPCTPENVEEPTRGGTFSGGAVGYPTGTSATRHPIPDHVDGLPSTE